MNSVSRKCFVVFPCFKSANSSVDDAFARNIPANKLYLFNQKKDAPWISLRLTISPKNLEKPPVKMIPPSQHSRYSFHFLQITVNFLRNCHRVRHSYPIKLIQLLPPQNNIRMNKGPKIPAGHTQISHCCNTGDGNVRTTTPPPRSRFGR